MEPDQSQLLTSPASSRSGEITVSATEQGLPVAITVDVAVLKQDPGELAARILRLCRRAADRAGLERRRQLSEAGVSGEVISLLGLPTADTVAERELADEYAYEMAPRTWSRRR